MQLFSSISGNGKTTLFVHGLFSSSRIWKGIIAKLGNGYSTLSVDLLGFGKSPKPDIEYTLSDHVEAVEATILQVKLEKPYTLVGQSIGAHIALEYARKHPTWVRRLILISPPVYVSRYEAKEVVRTYARIGYWFSFGILGYIAHAVEQLFKPISIALIPKISRRYKREILVDTFAHTWRSYSGTMEHIVYSSHFYATCKNISIPTVILYGSDDALIVPERLIELAKENPLITLKKLKGKHQFVYDYTDLIAEEITR